MKQHRLFSMLALTIILSLLLSAAGVSAAEASQPSISIGAPAQATKGQKVRVAITGSGLADLYGYEIQLNYDQAMMEYGSVSYDFSSQGYAVPVMNNAGHLTLAFTKIGDQTPGVSGTKTLLTVTFTARKSGNTSFGVSSVTLVNSQVQSTVLTPNVSASVTVVEPSGTSTPSTPSESSGEDDNGSHGEGTPEQVYGVDPSTIHNENGKSVVQIPAAATQITLSEDTIQAFGGNRVVLQSDNLSIELPTTVLEELRSKLPEGVTGTIALTMKPVDAGGAVSPQTSSSGSGGHTTIVSRGQAYDFSLSITGADGTATSLSAFKEPITMRFKTDAGVDPGLTGVYYVREDGNMEYIGGEWSGSELSADIYHFSTYAVLEVKTEYTDVPATHWANRVIAELSAKQVVKGIGEGEFRPGQLVTRAEFAALLVRGLKLPAGTGTDALPFTDVPADAWYAADVRAAYASGIVTGRSGNRFDPAATITRQEMAVMLVNAVKAKHKQQPQDSSSAPFHDMDQAGTWAVSSIEASYDLGLIRGRTADKFAPLGKLTRAEAAQAVYLLMKL